MKNKKEIILAQQNKDIIKLEQKALIAITQAIRAGYNKDKRTGRVIKKLLEYWVNDAPENEAVVIV